MITYEPFIAAFTGALTTFTSKANMTYTFRAPYPRIEKGRAYMMAIDPTTNQARLIPVVT